MNNSTSDCDHDKILIIASHHKTKKLNNMYKDMLFRHWAIDSARLQCLREGNNMK